MRDYKSYGILDKEMLQEENDLRQTASTQTNSVTALPKDEMVQQPEERIEQEIDLGSDIEENIEENADQRMDRVMSFESYKHQKLEKENRGLMKWGIRLVKLIVFLMLLPFISIICAVVGAIIAAAAASIILCITAAICLLGSICFMASQISGSLIAIGVIASIALFSLAGILSIICLMVAKWVIGSIKKRKAKRSDRKEGGR